MDFASFEKIAKNTDPEEGVFARFYDRTIKTKDFGENGLPKFRVICFCEIRIKDNNSEIFDQPATQEKINRFPLEYARYQLAKKQIDDGTPIEQFAFLSIAEVEALKFRGIYTIEALCELDENGVLSLDLKKEQDLAKSFIDRAKLLNGWEQREKEYLDKIQKLEKEVVAFKSKRKMK